MNVISRTNATKYQSISMRICKSFGYIIIIILGNLKLLLFLKFLISTLRIHNDKRIKTNCNKMRTLSIETETISIGSKVTHFLKHATCFLIIKQLLSKISLWDQEGLGICMCIVLLSAY